MTKKALTIGFVASTLVAFSIVGAGCKKEEPKEAAPASSSEPAKVSEPEKSAEGTAAGFYNAQITVKSPLQTAKAGSTVPLRVKIKNLSSETWARDKENPINVSYHWKKAADNTMAVRDGARSFITKDVAPGEELTLDAKIVCPNAPGKYILEVDMVKDTKDGGWFSRKGGTEAQSMSVTIN